MAHSLRSLLLVALAFALQSPAAAQATPAIPPGPATPAAVSAAAWYDGLIQYSTITNCVSIIQGLPYQEYGAGVYTGYLANPDAGQPSPNTTYYIHVVIAGLGNACSGMRAVIDVALPANTTTAITPANRVYCFYDGVPLAPADCPQTLPPSPYNNGAYAVWSTDAAHANTWPIPLGRILEIQIPVQTSTTLNNSALQANVWMLDGNSSPWLRPQQGVYVFSNQPAIIYPSPSSITVTATSARSQAYLYAFGTTGTGYFDLGTSTGYGLVHEPVAISTPGPAWLVWDDWGPPALAPDTLYHWRFTYTTGGSTYYGADQTFRTLPAGRVTIGQGQAAGCTDAALSSALAQATTREILFNCGTLPVTITLSGARSIASGLTINGGNRVTLLSGGAANHFIVQAGAHLTLTQLSLGNGLNTAACGGSVTVLAGARLTLNETRFTNNRSSFQGGAVCNYGSADIAATLFMSNATGNHGGAIGNYGTLRITNSKFERNRAPINGGGIDSVGSLAITEGVFASNTAGYRGGGVNTYVGTLAVTRSSFISNSAGLYGGGLANDTSIATVSASTFSDNYSANIGGGLETSGIGSLTLVNSTVSGNRAITNGGGLYWTSGAGPVTILNVTFADNQAGTQGGNIHVGGVGVYNGSINLKNTLVSGGTPNNCSGTLLTLGNNLESADSCGLSAGSDQRNTNPQLGTLANNGGPALTRRLEAGSPAIDAGTNSGCPAADQRGVARPIDGNRDGVRVCDIGAVEAQSLVFLPLLRR